jgi:hypothetical protein
MIAEIKVSPDKVVLSTGEVYQFVASCYDFQRRRIIGKNDIRWSSSSFVVYVNPYTGQARIYTYSTSKIYITATTRNCEGEVVTGSAEVIVSSTTPGSN